MDNVFVMEVVCAIDDLMEELACLFFFHAPLRNDVIEQFATAMRA